MAKKEAGPKKQRPSQPFAELPPVLDIRKIGRPSKYDPSFCDLVLELGAMGKSKAQMAASVGVSRNTMDQWGKRHPEFQDALKNARELELAWWEDVGQINMTRMGFNATAFIFQMKNRFREDYRDVTGHEMTGKDGGPIVAETADTESARRISYTLGLAIGRMKSASAEA